MFLKKSHWVISSMITSSIMSVFFCSLYNSAVCPLLCLFVDTGAVCLSAHLYWEISKTKTTHVPHRCISAFLLSHATGHPKHRNLLGSPVCSVRLLVFHTETFDRARWLLGCIVLKCFRRGQHLVRTMSQIVSVCHLW